MDDHLVPSQDQLRKEALMGRQVVKKIEAYEFRRASDQTPASSDEGGSGLPAPTPSCQTATARQRLGDDQPASTDQAFAAFAPNPLHVTKSLHITGSLHVTGSRPDLCR
jgi:hypothetical protein